MRRVLLSVFLIFVSFQLRSQLNHHNNLPGVLPPGPSASEFLKYGEIPISKYTGVPSISVPIYNIKTRGLDIPIFLTYHSNGIKVNEESSWVGLGWSLNPEGNIVQIVSGMDDFGRHKNRSTPNYQEIFDVATSVASGVPNGAFNRYEGTNIRILSELFSFPAELFPGGRCVTTPGTQSNSLPFDLTLGLKDYEPDIFKFNVLGYSGTFVLNWETEEFICLSDSRIKIAKNPNSHSEIEITLPEGHICKFSVKEETTIINQTAATVNMNQEKTSRVYKLDEIHTNKNDLIRFEYTVTQPFENYKSISKTKIDYADNSQVESVPFFGEEFFYREKIFTSYTEQSKSFLNKITFNNGVILFNLSNRLDIIGAKKLDNIQVKEDKNNANVIHNYTFSYDYFTSHSDDLHTEASTKTLNERSKRLKLNSILEAGKKPYIFDYNQNPLPQKTSYAQDFWGYYNGFLTNESLYPNIYRFNMEVHPFAPYNVHIGNNRSSRGQYAKSAILERITYPTGGYTAFQYELNSFKNYMVPNFEDTMNSTYGSNHVSYGAGLRIKKIENYDYDEKIINQKLYTYSGGKLMSPLHFLNSTFIRGYSTTPNNNAPWATVVSRGYRRKLSTSNFISPSVNAAGNYVGYDQVTEQNISNSNNNRHTGKIVSKYENNIAHGFYPYLPGWGNGLYAELNLPLRELNTPKNGSLLTENIYDENNTLLKKVKNSYDSKIREYCMNASKFGPPIARFSCGPRV